MRELYDSNCCTTMITAQLEVWLHTEKSSKYSFNFLFGDKGKVDGSRRGYLYELEVVISQEIGTNT